MDRKLSFEAACEQYVDRFTCEHVPDWAAVPRPDGTFYAPHYRTDREWYDATRFPGEPGHVGWVLACFSTGQTWPAGTALARPFHPRAKRVEARTPNASDAYGDSGSVAGIPPHRNPWHNDMGR